VDRISLTPDGAVSLLIDSQWQQFDHALVTVSLGVLQANQLIEPSLVTSERQSALKQMQLGVVDKIFVRFALPIELPNNCNHLWIIKQRLHRNWLDGLTGAAICFAGEHTSEKHYATVQGAFLSGVREARRLAAYYNLAEAKSDLAAMI
uniref:Amino_oxidase domain-containing protein n=1 Tax=Macrostomum lignano TaxID=282301 RepID=A0A1I8G2C7_9PLAT